MDHPLAYQTARGPLAGTALLMALGVPTASDELSHLADVGDRAADFGVAIIGAGPARDGDFAVHDGSCQRAAQPISIEDLELIREAACGCNWTAEVAITDLSLAPSAVQELTYGFYNALDCNPPLDGRGLMAEWRAVGFGAEASQVLENFLTANTPRRALEEAIRHGAARIRRYAEEAGASLRRNGMWRLQDILERKYAEGQRVDPDGEHVTADRRRASLAEAEAAVPGTDDGSVACFYRRLEPYLDIALASSGSAAYTVLPRRTRPVAVGVLPRRVAVLLYADCLLTGHMFGQSLAFAAAVGPRAPDLPSACRVAADLWTGGIDPEIAWHAAVATVY